MGEANEALGLDVLPPTGHPEESGLGSREMESQGSDGPGQIEASLEDGALDLQPDALANTRPGSRQTPPPVPGSPGPPQASPDRQSQPRRPPGIKEPTRTQPLGRQTQRGPEGAELGSFRAFPRLAHQLPKVRERRGHTGSHTGGRPSAPLLPTTQYGDKKGGNESGPGVQWWGAILGWACAGLNY